MITEQVINYIKDQLTRGISRDKIKSNLLAAGWVEEDVTQAFSFAEPKGPSAALKIAPAFAVPDEVIKETPVDKSLVEDEPVMPILKKDPEPTPLVQTSFAMPTSAAVTASPISSPVSPMMNPVRPNMPAKEVDDNLNDDDGEITKPKSSMGLKSLAIFLFLVLVVGNLFLWMFAYPAMNKNVSNLPVQNSTLVTENTDSQTARDTVEEPTLENPVLKNPTDQLIAPVQVLQNSAATYYSKNSSYGTKSMTLGSCDTATGVFTDASVKKTLSDISIITGTKTQCALAGDDPKKARMTSYLIYVPLTDGGFCVDSTGAALMISKIPTGTFCAEGI